MALFVMDEPQVGPTVVTLILSAVVWGTPLLGAVVGVVELVDAAVVLVDPAVVLVVVGAAVVEVVLPELELVEFPVSLQHGLLHVVVDRRLL